MLGSFEQSCTMPRQGLRPALVAACLLLNLLWTVFPPQVIQDNSELIVFCREFTMFCREWIVFCREFIMFCREFIFILPWVDCILPWVYIVLPSVSMILFCREFVLFCRDVSFDCKFILLCRELKFVLPWLFVSPLHLWATVKYCISFSCKAYFLSFFQMK